MSLPYDQASPKSIESYGKRLIGRTLRSVEGARSIPLEKFDQNQGGRTRGNFGAVLEEYYYGIKPGNSSGPDFPEAGVELKSTPVRKTSSGYSAKERLVLGMIPFTYETAKIFSESSLYRKCKDIMLVAYLHEKDRSILDLLIKVANLVRFDELPLEDRRIIENDWQLIMDKIRSGRAGELSEGDTMYLGACTKGANSADTTMVFDQAVKRRAFSLKSGYMTSLMRPMIDADPIVKSIEEIDESGSFEAVTISRFAPYIGKTVAEIHQMVGSGLNENAKNYYADLARRILGVKKQKIAEFEKADVVMKTIRVDEKGMPREDMSFPTFKYTEVIEEKWDADEELNEKPANIQELLQKRHFFVVYRCEGGRKDKNSVRLLKVMFWAMPVSDLDGHVRSVWAETIKRINEGRANDLPKKSDDPVCHIRPHAQNAKDTYDTPMNGPQVKKCFWLDKKYIKEQIIKG